VQHTNQGIERTERTDIFDRGSTAPRPSTGRMLAFAKPCLVSDFESVLLAIAAHDLRQPLQVIQSTHELLGLGGRTSWERRLLQSGQSAIDRIKDQLQQLQTALRLAERRGGVKLRPVRVDEVLRQACRESEAAALKNGISIRAVPTDASILSDHLLVGAVLRNLVANAVKYTQPGGRILVGSRRSGSDVRIDVYDTGIGIPDEQMPKIFEAFARLDSARCEGLGIGLFIVRQATGLLGHRIDLASTPGRGSRFSIFATHVLPSPNLARTEQHGPLERLQH
jgi:two-component system, OmpR family, phosphate regulon sensor histidine kinase PhoR